LDFKSESTHRNESDLICRSSGLVAVWILQRLKDLV